MIKRRFRRVKIPINFHVFLVCSFPAVSLFCKHPIKPVNDKDINRVLSVRKYIHWKQLN